MHVWRADLNQPETALHDFWNTLSHDERRRAERFCFEKDKLHFIVARGILRNILGRYLSISPRRLEFCSNSYGKPKLTETINQKNICFNLSHSSGLAVCVFTRARNIGVDIERVRCFPDRKEIAKRFFSREEIDTLNTLTEQDKNETFYILWTLKEAYIKARGKGLFIALGTLAVSFLPGGPAKLLSALDDPLAAEHWTLQIISPGKQFVGALAVEQGWTGRINIALIHTYSECLR